MARTPRQRAPLQVAPYPDDPGYQIDRAVQAIADADGDDSSRFAEAAAHAAIAQAVYMGQIAGLLPAVIEQLGELAARPAGYPADKLAELFGEMLETADKFRRHV